MGKQSKKQFTGTDMILMAIFASVLVLINNIFWYLMMVVFAVCIYLLIWTKGNTKNDKT